MAPLQPEEWNRSFFIDAADHRAYAADHRACATDCEALRDRMEGYGSMRVVPRNRESPSRNAISIPGLFICFRNETVAVLPQDYFRKERMRV